MAKGDKRAEQNEQPRSGQVVGQGHRVRPFEEVDRLFNEYWPRSLFRSALDAPSMHDMTGFEARLPRVNLVDHENEIVLHAELPGVDKKDVDISVSDDAVSIRATTRQEKKEEGADYYHHEISHGSFARTIVLPVSVDADKAEANFQNGILELKLPKVQQSKRRQIRIQ